MPLTSPKPLSIPARTLRRVTGFGPYIRERKAHRPTDPQELYTATLRPGSASTMFEDYDSGDSSDSTGAVEVAVQLSRFHVETLEQQNTTGDLDIRGLCLSAGDCELLADAHLALKRGVRYGLLGRNGSGKSTLLKACAKKTIPSFPRDMKVCPRQGSGDCCILQRGVRYGAPPQPRGTCLVPAACAPQEATPGSCVASA